MSVDEHYFVVEDSEWEESEEDVSDSELQNLLIEYLKAVLKWQYRAEGWFVSGNIAVYRHNNYAGRVVPDVMIAHEVALSDEQINRLSSWEISDDRPPPTVVFEVSSPATADRDVLDDQKPTRYGTLGISECFAYDPHTPQCWVDTTRRLRGWRYDVLGNHEEMQPNAQGWLHSEKLSSWLVPDGPKLRFYDFSFAQRITKEEAKTIAAREEQEARFRAEEATEAERKARLKAEEAAEAEREARLAIERAMVEIQDLSAKIERTYEAQLELERSATEVALGLLEVERAAKETERTAKEAALAQVEVERTAKEAALAQAQAERTDKEAEGIARQETEYQNARFRAMLRENNIPFE